MENIFFGIQAAAALKQFEVNGLSRYTQSNCLVTATDNGIRIYRPPNINQTNNGNTMWGGIKIINSSNTNINHTFNSSDNLFNLQQGHTYIIYFHVKGQSSNTFTTFNWTNQMGYNGYGKGIMPSPSDISSHKISTNFNGEDDCFYKFTINDTISKTCTTSYSYATEGNEYLSYNHFGIGFTYSDTGSLGTDLYFTNFRMYDITNGTQQQILKTGIGKFTSLIERKQQLGSINKYGEILGGQFYEN